jgi:hypothetical protein
VTGPIRPQPGHPGVYRYDAVACPACGKPLDAATNSKPGERAAQDGDFSVCAGCGVVSIFVIGALGVGFRTPTPDEMAEFTREYGHMIITPPAYLT